ncbi:MAG: hypothetical protein AABX29_04240 [Nanoarchaeota archaeon]
MTKIKKESKNPLWNIITEEWTYLGSRRKIYLIYLFLFFILVLGQYPVACYGNFNNW